MTRRSGLGRHARVEEATGDPLDGLVNLFDIGIVLAVAFLIAGLGLTLDAHGHALRTRAQPASGAASVAAGTHALPSPAHAPRTSGRGRPVGTVYRLSDGELVYVAK